MAVGELPEPLRRAWGVVPLRAARGPVPRLSVNAIIETAVALGDEGGLAAVSLTGVGKRLGVTVNALYRYLGSREELHVLASEHALGVPPPRRETPPGWPDAVLAWATALRDRYREHPWLVDMPVRLPMTPHALTWLEALLEALRAAPFATGDKLRLAAVLDRYVRSSARSDRDFDTLGPPASPDTPAVRAIATLLADYDLPLVAAVFAEGHWRESMPGDDFSFGLTCLLTGLQAGGSLLFKGVFPPPVSGGGSSETPHSRA